MQDRAIEFLKTSIEQGRLSHSLLFFGPEAVGKRFTAKIIAKALNCEVAGPSDCCDRCPSCRKVDSFNHPDVHWVRPEGAGNKIRIEKIRLMKGDINLKPFEGKVKVFIIENAHFLADEAANSMLKTLEEPSKDSLIILIVDDLNKIFPTIRSRCQWVFFSSVRPERLKKFLVDTYKIKDKDAHFLSHLSEGRIGKAIDMKDKKSLDWKNDVVDKFTTENIIFREDPFFFDNKRGKILDIVDILISWYRDMFIAHHTKDNSLLVNADRIEELRTRSESLSDEKIRKVLNETLRARTDIERNVNPKLVLSNLACQIEDTV